MKIVKDIKFRGVKIQLSEKATQHQKNKPTPQRFKDGSYEKLEIDTILPYINDETVILNLGASVGGLASVVNNKMKIKTNMLAVEANPNLIEDLNNNRNINTLGFHIEHGAISSTNKKVHFNFNGLSLSGSIFRKKWLEGDKWGNYNSLEMETITPMDLETKYNLKFNTLSCDIEGEELTLLEDLIEYFKNFKVMVIEFHNYQTDSKIRQKQIVKKYSPYFKITNLGHSMKFIKK
jgi:FkbM family methyltransferase